MSNEKVIDAQNEDLSFELAYAKLGTVLKALESDDLALEKSVELYESGVELVRLCNARLDSAELRIEELAVSQSGEPVRTVREMSN